MKTDEVKLYPPTLYVGLGGAGCDVVNRIAGKLKKRDDWNEIGDIFQFFVVDTDRRQMEVVNNIPQAHRFIISGFDKGRYVDGKLGRAGLTLSKPDPKVSQWVHDWYNFRSSQGAGAGQIRIESRISLYNSFESTDLIKRLEDAIAKTIDMKNSFVDTRVKKMNVMLYFSVAGGTGSGSNLMMAAMLRHLVENMGWSANIIGVAMMPTWFLQYIRNPRQREDIFANGYATLKEIENLMKLKVRADESTKESMLFVYHPFISSNRVEDSPFDFVYIIDTTTDIYIGDSYKEAVADGVYLQLMSPLFVKRDSDYDNYEKNQKRLARELFTVHYGSFGCSVLLVPDQDILKYCALRLTIDHIFQYISGSFSSKEESEDENENVDQEEIRARQDRNFCHRIREQMESDKSIRKMYAKLGINELFTFEKFANAADEIEDKRKQKDDVFEELIEAINRKNFEAKFQNHYLASIYSLKPITLEADIEIEEEDQQSEYLGVRKALDDTIKHYFLKQVLDIIKKNDFSNKIEMPASRDGKNNEERQQSVREDLSHRIDEFSKRLRQLERDIESVGQYGIEYFKNVRNIVGFVSDQKLDLRSQQFWAIILINELKLRIAVLNEVKNSDWNNILYDQLKSYGKQDRMEPVLKAAKKSDVIQKGGIEKERLDYEQTFKNEWALKVKSVANEIHDSIYFDNLIKIYEALKSSVNSYLMNLRNFSNSSAEIIQGLMEEANHMLEAADEQANEFELDIEVLQDLNDRRLWGEYYDLKIKDNIHLKEEDVVRIINHAFASEILLSPRDKAEWMKEKLMDNAVSFLKNQVTGKYKEGDDRSKRGLLIDDGLKLEAEIKFIEYLKWVNKWEDQEEIYNQFKYDQEETSHSLRKFQEELKHFTKNYLEHKLLKCLRRSGILANINTNDPDVVEYACKQMMVAYDTELYKPPEHGGEEHFVTILKKIAPEGGEKHVKWKDDAKKVIFYQAILGVPLFTFRNVVGLMKEAYNKRVLERDWQNPRKGRQYPLHIDKNWESDDPFVDPTNLPLNLDPDEALQRHEDVSAMFNQFLASFLKLTRNDYIEWNDEHGYMIPRGKLGNIGGDVILGRSEREALVKILQNVRAHEKVNEETAKIKLTKEEVSEIKKQFEPFVQKDLWPTQDGRVDGIVDGEIDSLINMLDSLINAMEEEEELTKRRKNRPNLVRVNKNHGNARKK